MSDLIDRQTAIETAIEAADKWDGGYSSEREGIIRKFFDKVPAVQPDHTADIGKKVSIPCAHENDLIFRQAAIDALAGMIDRFERILADIRETKGDDSVCGMCEYDGAYIGQSGDWCNECPGFDKDDCFKLSDRCRKRWMGETALQLAVPSTETTAPSTDDWIPVGRELPEDLAEVNVTWVNHEPEPYYEPIKSKPFTASAVYYEGNWYWYSSVCADVLGEYGQNDVDKVDDTIEITAWKPLPEPYRGGEK